MMGGELYGGTDGRDILVAERSTGTGYKATQDGSSLIGAAKDYDKTQQTGHIRSRRKRALWQSVPSI